MDYETESPVLTTRRSRMSVRNWQRTLILSSLSSQFRQEHRLGSIEFGKIANMTVFDCDFLHDDIEKVAQANLIATIVDGEEVFKA